MKLSTMLTYGGDPRAAADQVAALEAAGLDTVWVAEGYGYDSPTLMGYLAARTRRSRSARRSSTSTPARRRCSRRPQPGSTASPAAARSSVWAPPDPQVDRGLARAAVHQAAGPHQGDHRDHPRGAAPRAVEYHGTTIELPLPAGQGTGLGKPLKMMTKPARSAVPLYIAALGPKSVQGAAEYADGWLPFLYSPEGAPKVWGDALAAGRPTRSADLAPLEVVAGGMVAIGEDVKGMLDFVRPMFALYIGGMGARGKNFYNELAAGTATRPRPRRIQDLYLDGKKKEAEAAVPLELLEQGNLVGPASYVKERIDAFRESGVTNLQVMPASDDPAALVRRLKEWVA